MKIKFKKIKTKIVLNNKFIKKIVHPIFLAFPIFLIFLFKRAKFFLNPFIRKKKMNQNLFVNYFVGSSLLKKNLHSVYWGNLDEVLDTNKIKRTWLHLSVPEGNPNNSEELLNKLNTNPLSEHVVLDSYFNVKIFLKIILVWFKIILKINKIEKKLKGNSKDKFFYVLFRNDFKENIFGYKFLINLYYFYLFKLFFNQNREYKNCFYLYENQSWERSLIYNLNANKMKTNKFGIIHSSVRFWDLRYAKMNNLYNNSELLNFSHDKIFVSSKIFKKILLDNNINDNQIILGETLRYKYISNFDENIFINKNNDYLVVLGDYSVNINKKIEVCINLLSKNNRCKIICKPHPLNDFKEIYKHNSNIYKSLETVQELSEKYNNFVVPSTSTVGLELYLMGKNVITVLDDELINYSPLKHYYKYQNYVYDINLIQKKVDNGIKNFPQINFFEQSKNLETWIKIIKNV